jgi:hypothetical protein
MSGQKVEMTFSKHPNDCAMDRLGPIWRNTRAV